MQIRHVIIKVDNQNQALAFYTSRLGFVKKQDISIGGVRWLTVASSQEAEGVELVLEPNHFPPARIAQKVLYDAAFPAAVFTTTDIAADYRRLQKLGVQFRGEPRPLGPVTTAFFDDTCGNLIALNQPAS